MIFDNLLGYVLIKFQHIIPLSSRDRAIFTFSEFGARQSLEFSEFKTRQNLDQSQIDNLLGYIMSISMCMQNFSTIFHSIQEIVSFSLFQNLELGKASTADKCHFAISWARSCQYQCVCESLSNYSKRFKSYGHFSLFVRGQNVHKLSGDKIKCTLKVNLQFQLSALAAYKRCKFRQNITACLLRK